VKQSKNLSFTNGPWEDCQAFIKKLNDKTKGGYRLPTEAEWEFSCRAGTTTTYSFGDEITPQDANIIESKIRTLVAVGSYKPNAFGLFDMHGNVNEWCEDWYSLFLQRGEVIDPKGPATGERRVMRGGISTTLKMKLALPSGSSAARRPLGTTSMGSAWRGHINYYLAPNAFTNQVI